MNVDDSVAPPAARYSRQLGALSAGMSRETVRDPMTLFFSVGFPLILATFFVAMAQMTWASGTGVVAVEGDQGQATAVEQAWDGDMEVVAVATLDTSDDAYDAHVAFHPDSETVRVEVPVGKGGVIPDLEAALADTEWDGWSVSATSIGGGPLFDPIAFILPAALTFALFSVALTGTAGALVSLRANGTLRLLGTTPARRSAVLLALVPSRAGFAVILLAVAGTAAILFGVLEPASMIRMLVTTTIGMAMVLPMGYLLGGVLSNVELTNMIAAFLTPVLLMASGVLFPWEVISDSAAGVAALTPPGMFGDALRNEMVGGVAHNPLWLNWLGMALTAVALIALAARSFRWTTKETA
ncbi:ABC transporter permease [Spiractinospora alimapuensis]|uniref:ABC transporter permease n=1 Tax=Spiractinospora alimapuensis TaxID=2820884 RepID=UPI001F1BC9F5|nr:ABC transporter permease [Spiractinospora alimapuensis]QVQ50235.1 ABC transporter permease [Spiractinospora alimapuensis]